MNNRNKISDEELRDAAIEVMQYELEIFDSYADYLDHTFRGEFRLKMGALLHDVKRGAVKAAEYSMGFAFYAKRCIAAVLLIFTLTCIAMPETVLAGYQKLIEVIETVFEEYTEYRYRVNEVGGIEEEFRPLKLGYLPEGMKEVRYKIGIDECDVLYESVIGKYLNLYQKRISDNEYKVTILDTESMVPERIQIKNGYAELLEKNERIHFVWLDENNQIIGQTNLQKEELIKVLDSATY